MSYIEGRCLTAQQFKIQMNFNNNFFERDKNGIYENMEIRSISIVLASDVIIITTDLVILMPNSTLNKLPIARVFLMLKH